jgi:hypothetical protein
LFAQTQPKVQLQGEDKASVNEACCYLSTGIKNDLGRRGSEGENVAEEKRKVWRSMEIESMSAIARKLVRSFIFGGKSRERATERQQIINP